MEIRRLDFRISKSGIGLAKCLKTSLDNDLNGSIYLYLLRVRPNPPRATGSITIPGCTGVKQMPKYYIEIPHEADKVACLKAIKVLKETGSHFLTNACYGCKDGDHTARIIIDLDSKEQAMMVIPRAYRSKAFIVQLSSFSLEEVDNMLKYHASQSS
jgi:hypothetical protein